MQLILTNPESSLNKIVHEVEGDIEQVGNLVNTSEKLLVEIHNDLEEVNDVRTKVREKFARLNILQCTYQYMKVIQHIENLRLVKKSIFYKIVLFICLLVMIYKWNF